MCVVCALVPLKIQIKRNSTQFIHHNTTGKASMQLNLVSFPVEFGEVFMHAQWYKEVIEQQKTGLVLTHYLGFAHTVYNY